VTTRRAAVALLAAGIIPVGLLVILWWGRPTSTAGLLLYGAAATAAGIGVAFIIIDAAKRGGR
jgi:hypothetical protein